MFKITFVVVGLFLLAILPLRLGITSGGFFRDGIMEGLQSCRQDSDCVWVPTGCCTCEQGGGELLINREKEWLYTLLVKEVCLGEQYCSGGYACTEENSNVVYCDRTCKFGKRSYTKPLLAP